MAATVRMALRARLTFVPQMQDRNGPPQSEEWVGSIEAPAREHAAEAILPSARHTECAQAIVRHGPEPDIFRQAKDGALWADDGPGRCCRKKGWPIVMMRQPCRSTRLLFKCLGQMAMGSLHPFWLSAADRIATGKDAVDQCGDRRVKLGFTVQSRIVRVGGSGVLKDAHDFTLGQHVPIVQRQKQRLADRQGCRSGDICRSSGHEDPSGCLLRAGTASASGQGPSSQFCQRRC